MTVLRWLLCLLLLLGLLLLARPDDAITQSFVQRAAELRASIDYGLAADYLRVALVRQPWSATLHMKLAEALALQHREVEAQQALAEAEQLGADATTVERLRAVWAEKNQRYAEAAQRWQLVSERRPLDETAYRHAVASALQAEQWAAARSTAERWRTALNSPEARFTLAKLAAFDDPAAAQTEWQASKDDQAQPFLQALQQSDRTLQLTLLGRAYLAQNDLTLAQRAFEQPRAEVRTDCCRIPPQKSVPRPARPAVQQNSAGPRDAQLPLHFLTLSTLLCSCRANCASRAHAGLGAKSLVSTPPLGIVAPPSSARLCRQTLST
jgi:hypothetical protein